MKKRIGFALALCVLLVGCSGEGEVESASGPDASEAGGLVQVSSVSPPPESVYEPESAPESVPEEMGQAAAQEEIPAVDTWAEYTFHLESAVITCKLPPFFTQEDFDGTGVDERIICDPESDFYQMFPGRDGNCGGFRDEGEYEYFTRISETEYDVAEVGQAFRYILSESLEPKTFFYEGDWIVFVSGPGYYLPTTIYDTVSGYSLWFYFEGDPAVPVGLFKQIAQTMQVELANG